MTEQELNKIYTDNIKSLRMKMGLSQAELADKINISEKYLSVLENGKKWGSFETLDSMLNLMKCYYQNFKIHRIILRRLEI